MNRDETTKLLEILCGNYNKKIVDPKATVNAWEMTLGAFSAEAVYKAARLHMSESKYWPNPADIREKIVKAKIVYDGPPLNALPPQRAQALDEAVKIWEPYLDAIWDECLALELEGKEYLRQKGRER